jgi:hypothetical protein
MSQNPAFGHPQEYTVTVLVRIDFCHCFELGQSQITITETVLNVFLRWLIFACIPAEAIDKGVFA